MNLTLAIDTAENADLIFEGLRTTPAVLTLVTGNGLYQVHLRAHSIRRDVGITRAHPLRYKLEIEFEQLIPASGAIVQPVETRKDVAQKALDLAHAEQERANALTNQLGRSQAALSRVSNDLTNATVSRATVQENFDLVVKQRDEALHEVGRLNSETGALKLELRTLGFPHKDMEIARLKDELSNAHRVKAAAETIAKAATAANNNLIEQRAALRDKLSSYRVARINVEHALKGFNDD